MLVIKVLMIMLGILLIFSSLAFSLEVGSAIDSTANAVTGLTENKANLISNLHIDTVTLVMIFMWIILIMMAKDKIVLISMIGGILLILYSRGYLGNWIHSVFGV